MELFFEQCPPPVSKQNWNWVLVLIGSWIILLGNADHFHFFTLSFACLAKCLLVQETTLISLISLSGVMTYSTEAQPSFPALASSIGYSGGKRSNFSHFSKSNSASVNCKFWNCSVGVVLQPTKASVPTIPKIYRFMPKSFCIPNSLIGQNTPFL